MNVINCDLLCFEKSGVDAGNPFLSFQHDDKVGSFRSVFGGGSGSGKTNLLISMLLQGQIKFDHLYLYTKSIEQPKYKLLIRFINSLEKEYEKATGQPIDMLTIGTSIDDIVPLDEIDKTKINLAIFDDLLTEKHQEIIEEYYIKGRHSNVSCIYLTQSYFDTPKVLKKNSNYFVLFGVSSKNELISLAKDHSLEHDMKTFKTMIRTATRGNDFFLIDRRTTHDILKHRKNFDHVWDAPNEKWVPLSIEEK